jgi:hypothetical protein
MRWFAVTTVLLTASLARADDAPPVLHAEDGDPFAIGETNRLNISVAHAFAKSEVIERLGYLLAYWKKRFNITSTWRGDRVFLSGSVYGIKVQALFQIDAKGVNAFAADPGWPWRGQIVSYVDQKLKKYLHPTYDEP